MARPSKLTPELRDRIAAAVLAGNFLEPAARAHGVRPTTLYRWLKLGEAGRSPYREFREAVEQARGECELGLVATLRSQAPRSPTAALALLKQLFPERWTPVERRVVASAPERSAVAPFTVVIERVDRPPGEDAMILGQQRTADGHR